MQAHKTGLTLLLVSALAGCASVRMADTSRDAELKSFRAPTDKAGVYVYRNEAFGAAVRMDVLVDGSQVGETASKTYLYFEVPPGTHTITSKAENVDEIKTEFAAQTLTYFWQEVRMGVLYARTKLHLVGEAEGRAGVLETKLAATNDVAFPTPKQSPRPQVKQPFASSGSGFTVQSPTTFITAFHVVDGADTLKVTCADGKPMVAEVQKIDRANDLALLTLPMPAPAFVELAPDNSIAAGQRIFTVGFPAPGILGTEAKYSDGSVSSLSGLGGSANLLQITIPIQPGNSGGPVATEDGRVIGVVTSTAAVQAFFRTTGALPQNVNWAVRGEYVRPLLSGIAASRPPSQLTPVERVIKSSCLITAFKQ